MCMSATMTMTMETMVLLDAMVGKGMEEPMVMTAGMDLLMLATCPAMVVVEATGMSTALARQVVVAEWVVMGQAHRLHLASLAPVGAQALAPVVALTVTRSMLVEMSHRLSRPSQ